MAFLSMTVSIFSTVANIANNLNNNNNNNNGSFKKRSMDWSFEIL